ncbi:MAG: pyrroline-5-carboxylate reductase [Candidatus Nanopelagicales bacterium]|nr:pyrroline-5-carboxylate reductase [Candidatus Nanopelagicales bacterium]
MSLVIGVIGAGSMGQALMAGWAEREQTDREQTERGQRLVAVVRDLPKYQHLESDLGITVTDNRSALGECHVVVIAIKPQVIREILSEFAPHIAPGALVISVAAGITTHYIAHTLPTTDQIVRAMPNTPSIIGRGVTGISGAAACTPASLELARDLLSAVGAVVEVPESQQNALAAVSGSGPAYLYYLAEYMISGARELGLDQVVAEQLVRETLLGAAQLWEVQRQQAPEREITPAALRAQVTSPGGMTAAAMGVLDTHEVNTAIEAALARGVARAQELGAP